MTEVRVFIKRVAFPLLAVGAVVGAFIEAADWAANSELREIARRQAAAAAEVVQSPRVVAHRSIPQNQPTVIPVSASLGARP